MRKIAIILLLGAISCGARQFSSPLDGPQADSIQWLYLSSGPYTLETPVDVTGPVTLALVRDVSLMGKADTVFQKDVVIGEDGVLTADLGRLDPGFYQVRAGEAPTFNIGVRPEEVVSPPDAKPDFDAFWESTLAALEEIPLERTMTKIPAYSNDKRTCFEVRYKSFGGEMSGGIISIPVQPGKYPVWLNFMGYGAEPFYFDPSANPERIVATGESQGGAFTVVAAALDSRIKAIAPSVPFMGDFPDYGKIVSWPVHEVLMTADAEGLDRQAVYELLSYFDVKNFAPRVKCPAYMAFGLQDPTCPPHTNFAIYNNLGSAEKHYHCVPTCGHAMWLEPSWQPIRDAFLDSYTSL